MQSSFISDYIGKFVNIVVNNKIVTGIISQLKQDHLKLQTDYGLVILNLDKIQDVQQLNQIKPIYIYVCKNQLCKCKGIRLLNNKDKLNWPCKYYKKFNCPIKKVTNFHQLPLQLKNKFLDGLHSQIPIIQK